MCQFLHSKNYFKTRRVNAQYEGLNVNVHIFWVLETKFFIFMVFKIFLSKLILKIAGWCKLSVPVCKLKNIQILIFCNISVKRA